jgi:catechol 2,3-dioxygenase-like lactoylglutathione lyase family enzyme
MSPQKPESAADFATASRIHFGIAVRDLNRSRVFYRTLFGQEPTKERPRYARFEVAEPPLNLALNEVGGQTGPNNPVSHFGIQVKSTAAVQKVAARLEAAGVVTDVEQQVTCCYAVQNKVWATDPDGNRWEVYVVLDDHGASHSSTNNSCCSGLPEVKSAMERGDLRAAYARLEQVEQQRSACSCAT